MAIVVGFFFMVICLLAYNVTIINCVYILVKGLFNSIAYGLNSSVRRAIHERLDL